MSRTINWPLGCKWPNGNKFTFADEPGEHDPCYVVMPDGAMLSLNHYNDSETDITRAQFIIAACNYYLHGHFPADRERAIEVMAKARNALGQAIQLSEHILEAGTVTIHPALKPHLERWKAAYDALLVMEG